MLFLCLFLDGGYGKLEILKPYHPDFSVNLLNLTALPDAKLIGPPEVTAALWSLKYARGEIEKALTALERLAETVGDVFVHNPVFDFLMVYLLAASNRTPEEIIDMVNSIIHGGNCKNIDFCNFLLQFSIYVFLSNYFIKNIRKLQLHLWKLMQNQS